MNPEETMREAALADLELRRRTAPEKIDNVSLAAGAPMYFYCGDCGWLADIKSEGYFLEAPRKRCGECQVMRDKGWIE